MFKSLQPKRPHDPGSRQTDSGFERQSSTQVGSYQTKRASSTNTGVASHDEAQALQATQALTKRPDSPTTPGRQGAQTGGIPIHDSMVESATQSQPTAGEYVRK